MFRFPFVIIMLLFSLFSVDLPALEVSDLYQANVVVDSQTREQREQAIKQGLQSVFLKVGGKKSVLAHKVLKKAQRRASSYVSQYRYQRKNEQLSLVVIFNEDKVNQLFKEAKLALWGSLRPQVLLWLIDEQGASRTIIASDADSTIPESVHDFSVKRGLPIIMPLMDLTDNEQVVLSDFWGYFPEQIQQASSRYFADTTVVMRVSDSSLVSQSELKEPLIPLEDVDCGLLCQDQEVETPKVLEWRIYSQGTLYIQRYQGVDKDNLIEQALSDITELIYQSYALLASAENDVVIEVENITSLTSDTHVFQFLTDLSAVKAVTLISAQGSVRRFKLELVGSQTSFLASLKLNRKLTRKIATQLDDISVTEEVNELYDANADYQTDSAISLRTQMRIVVLGENKDVAENAQGKAQGIRQDNTQGNIQDSIVGVMPVTDLSTETLNTLDTEQGTEFTLNEQGQSANNMTPQLTIVPKIPVFYWEQG